MDKLNDELKDYVSAIANYNKAIELNPNDADAYYDRGMAKVNLKEYYSAIPDFHKAIELNNNYVGSYAAIAICKKALGDMDGYNEYKKLNIYDKSRHN